MRMARYIFYLDMFVLCEGIEHRALLNGELVVGFLGTLCNSYNVSLMSSLIPPFRLKSTRRLKYTVHQSKLMLSL